MAAHWTKSETELLRQMNGLPLAIQSKRLGKPIAAIKSKRMRLGLPAIPPDDLVNLATSASVPSEPHEPGPQIETEREETPDESKIKINNLRFEVKTLEDLIHVCDVDVQVWQIERWKCKAYGGFVKGADKKPIPIQLFSVSADLRRKKGVDFRKEIDLLIEEAKAHSPLLRKPPVEVTPSTGLMLELSIPDLHIGKLSWHEECGESYDSKIAEALFEEATADLLAKVSVYRFDEITLVVGNDFLNADNSQNTTTRGTPQAGDTRHQKTFGIARRLIQDLVEHRLRGLAPKVNIIVVPGNHDQQTTYFLGEALSAWFRNAEDVWVDNRPKLRKYVRFGKVLIGYTHGDKEKQADLPLIMATEVPDEWSQTLYREMHTGHLHQKRATNFRSIAEHNGVIVRILPSLSAAEDWHTAKGYVGNIRSAEAYIWDRETGLVGTAVFNVRPS